MQPPHRPRKLFVFFGVALTLLAGAGVGAAVYYALKYTEPAPTPPPSPPPPEPPTASPQPGPTAAPTPACPAPRVTVAEGELLGACRPANVEKGIPQYAAFLGVPYAKPPLGELRFKAPRPAEPWQGVREAVLFDQRCTQGPVDALFYSEDCLHVNVYSTWLQEPHKAGEGLLPVLVHVHGGAMKEGTGNIIRPDYFVATGVVVVTFNYRLGHMGFLSQDSELAPGNAGLKDMVAALKWLRANLAAFGGDPDKVTLQGCSSAAAAVHWLTLLPETEGLFHGAIIKSGSAMVAWAYTDQGHLDLSRLSLDFLANKLYVGLPEEQILHYGNTLGLELGFTYAEATRPKTSPATFLPPTVALERRADGPEPKLIVKDAEALILQPARTRVPIVMGMTSCEYDPYGPMYYLLGKVPPIDSPLLEAFVPRGVIPTDFAKQALGLDPATYPYTYADAADDLRNHLFNLKEYDPDCDIICRWSNYFSATLIKADTARAIRMHAREDKAPVYAYYYDYPIDGTCALHAHEDKKLWPESEVDVMQLNTTDSLALNVLRQVKLWSNFVKFGKPVPETDDTILPVEWTPMVKGEPDRFLRFGRNLTMDRGDLLGDFGSFWSGLFSKYRGGGDQI